MKITKEHIDRKARFSFKSWPEGQWFEPVSIRGKRAVGWDETGAGAEYDLKIHFIEITPSKKPSEIIESKLDCFPNAALEHKIDAILTYLDEIHDLGKI